jgi:hypothetical protein
LLLLLLLLLARLGAAVGNVKGRQQLQQGGIISRAVRITKMMYLDGTTVFELDADE